MIVFVLDHDTLLTNNVWTHYVAGVECFHGSLFKIVKIMYSLLTNVFIRAPAEWVDFKVQGSPLPWPLPRGLDSPLP